MKEMGVLICLCACLAPAFAQDKKADAEKTVEAIKQLERDWTDAEKAADLDKLGQIVADDWRGLQPDGTIINKRQLVADIKSGASKIESEEIGPMEVKLMGRVAVVMGSDTEKSSLKGKDTSGKWIWMDVFVNRNDKWVAVRSQAAMVK